MSGMDDLVTWLRAQLDDDEQGALNAQERDWRPDGAKSCEVFVLREDGSNRTIAWCANGYEDDFANALHIARHDPARVLRKVKANRAILDEHCGSGITCPRCCYGIEEEPEDGDSPVVAYAQHPCTTLRLLALSYADWPGYREEWRP